MKALVVDDDRNTVEVIRKAISWESLGIDRVFFSYEIETAKKILEKEEVDIIISDIEMPMGTGIDLIIWAREHQKKGEFLFLTCHESFEFASYAIQYQAAAYLIKPFEPEKMEIELRRLIFKRKREQDLKDAEKYRAMWAGSIEYLENGFWEELLYGHMPLSREAVRKEIARRKLSFSVEERWVMLIACARKYESAWEEWEDNTLEYALVKLGSEVLRGEMERQSILYASDDTSFYMIEIVSEKHAGELLERGRKLLQLCDTYFDCSMTGYLSNPCDITGLAGVRNRVLKCDRENLLARGNVLMEKQWETLAFSEKPALDMGKVEEKLSEGNRIGVLNELKRTLEELVEKRIINTAALRTIQTNLTQIVYVYLYKNGIQADELFGEEQAVTLKERAANSAVDMMKWQNYLIGRALTYVREVQRSSTIIQKVEQYVQEHFREDISRSEMAAMVYLTPEYLAKLFKKDTGLSLKDYVYKLRIEEAKRLLRCGRRVSEVAQEVGFDNFSYFSTVFRRVSGFSPNEYKKAQERE